VLDTVVNTINYDKPSHRSNIDLLTHYFNHQPTVLIPPKESLFKFKLGQQVRVDRSKKARQDFSYKYSLAPGEPIFFLLTVFF
jgi:hypothetical protein